jgi:hypothetical protein
MWIRDEWSGTTLEELNLPDSRIDSRIAVRNSRCIPDTSGIHFGSTTPIMSPFHSVAYWMSLLVAGDRASYSGTLTTHPHLVPRSWMNRSYTSSPPKRHHGVQRDCKKIHITPPYEATITYLKGGRGEPTETRYWREKSQRPYRESEAFLTSKAGATEL